MKKLLLFTLLFISSYITASNNELLPCMINLLSHKDTDKFLHTPIKVGTTVSNSDKIHTITNVVWNERYDFCTGIEIDERYFVQRTRGHCLHAKFVINIIDMIECDLTVSEQKYPEKIKFCYFKKPS